MPTDSLFLLTGGPGSGKSTLLSALAQAGHATFPEAGRGILAMHDAIGGPARQVRDPLLYAELMLAWDIRSHDMACAMAAPAFFDRGVPDTIGFLSLLGLTVPAHMEEAARRYRYARKIIVAPPWREIYRQDAHRTHGFQEAVLTHEWMCRTYSRLGYDLVELPKADVGERIAFVLALVR